MSSNSSSCLLHYQSIFSWPQILSPGCSYWAVKSQASPKINFTLASLLWSDMNLQNWKVSVTLRVDQHWCEVLLCFSIKYGLQIVWDLILPAGKKNYIEQPIEESPVLLCEEVISKASLNFKASFPFALSAISVYAYGFKHLQCIYIYPQL